MQNEKCKMQNVTTRKRNQRSEIVMKGRYAVVLLLVCLVAGRSAWGADALKTVAKATILGHVSQTGASEVVLDQFGAVQKVPVNQIAHIVYEGEPGLLGAARSAIAGGRYKEALESLRRIGLDEIQRKEIRQDVEFYKAQCEAELALAGTGDLIAAGNQLFDFVKVNADSYHWLAANELVGDLLMASRRYAAAEKYYDAVAKAPWPDYQMRGGVLSGRALLAQDRVADASRVFESVLATNAPGKAAESQKMAATLGKARCLVAQKRSDEAVQLAQGVIDRTEPEDTELNAEAYNALGTALRSAGRRQDALLAFLHVDLLYSAAAASHAEALANLVELWSELHMPERAQQARQTLMERYPNSPWTAQ